MAIFKVNLGQPVPPLPVLLENLWGLVEQSFYGPVSSCHMHQCQSTAWNKNRGDWKYRRYLMFQKKA